MQDSNTLGEGKKFLRENWENGTNCPCCTQRVQLYKHKLNSTMTRSLIALYWLDRHKPNEWHHVSEFEKWRGGYGGGQFAKVKHWGFAIDQDNDDPAKRTSGQWKITQKGRDFVEGQITVPAKVRLFDSKFYGHEGNHINIKESLGSKFDYSELMEG